MTILNFPARPAGLILTTLTLFAATGTFGLVGGCESMTTSSNTSESATTRPAGITTSPFGSTRDGEKVTQYTLTNASGASVDIIDYGGAVRAVRVPDKNGRLENVTLAFDSIAGYETSSPYFGALIGRFGNRIEGGTFALNGVTYSLAKNNGPNHLHGGVRGFDKRMWNAQPGQTEQGQTLKLKYTSPDGEEGYPSTLETTVTYLWTADNELRINYEARNTGDKDTVVNLTNHCYWNLDGEGSGTILDHTLQLFADAYLPVDETSIPTGEKRSVEGTPFDFRQPKPIGRDIDQTDGDPDGYDHNFIVSDANPVTIGGTTMQRVARVTEPDSGRVLELFSTEPGVQLYTGNFLGGDEASGGYDFRTGFCLETQHFPNSPNEPDFPSTTLKAGETFNSTTVHRFSTKK